MDVLYERRCMNYVYVVPEGLRELMSDISREVLRHQPTHIYSFIADYLDALMITRENARVASKVVNELTNTGFMTVNFLESVHITRIQADIMATIIQRAFRKHLRRKMTGRPLDEKIKEKVIRKANVTLEEANNAARIIQKAYVDYKLSKAAEEHDDTVEWRIAFMTTLHEFYKTRATPEEAKRAAILLKAAYKGYFSHRIMKKIVQSIHKYESDVTMKESLVYYIEEGLGEEEDLISLNRRLEAEEEEEYITNIYMQPSLKSSEASLSEDCRSLQNLGVSLGLDPSTLNARKELIKNIRKMQNEEMDITLHEYNLDLQSIPEDISFEDECGDTGDPALVPEIMPAPDT